MKKQVFTIVFLMICSMSFAQKRKVEHIKKTGAILVNGEQWATVSTMRGNGNIARIFVLKDMQGNEIAYGKTYTSGAGYEGYYEIQFFPSQKTIYKQWERFDTARDMAMFLIEYNVLTKEGLNPSGEEKLVMLFSTPPNNANAPISTPSNPDNNSTLIQRNRSMPVFVFGDDVQQDGKKIGRIVRKMEFGQDVYQVFNHQNQLIAEARQSGEGDKNYAMVTLKDNRKHNVTTKGGTWANIKEGIAQYLVEAYYW